jgi:hypothetical protein
MATVAPIVPHSSATVATPVAPDSHPKVWITSCDQVHLSAASPDRAAFPVLRPVGIHDFPFEACSA